MKIAHIVDSMEVGGAERLVYEMCKLQREQGHDPSIYCILRIGVLGEELQREGFDVRLQGPFHLPTALWRFFCVFRQLRPDVVHCHNPTATIYAAPAARLAGVARIIATRHHLVAPPYNRAREIKFAIAARFCDWVVGVCDATVHNLSAAPMAYKSNLTRIYNGALTPPASCDLVPTKHGFTLVHIGRLAPVKNQTMLLDSFALARLQIPSLALWIVGDGPMRLSLQRHAADLRLGGHVTFFGEQSSVSAYLRGADAFVMCSVSEGLPVSLLEAMSAGLPVIVTDIGGMAEVVRLSGGGLVVPPNDPDALAKAMVGLARDGSGAGRFGTAGRRCFERTFTIARMVEDYMRLYTGRNTQTQGKRSTRLSWF